MHHNFEDNDYVKFLGALSDLNQPYSCTQWGSTPDGGYSQIVHDTSSDIYNIGNEQGYSVREIIDMVEEITQTKIPYKISEKRKGDPAVLIADNSKITEKLNWRAKYSDLNTIINTAWEWEKKLSNF